MRTITAVVAALVLASCSSGTTTTDPTTAVATTTIFVTAPEPEASTTTIAPTTTVAVEPSRETLVAWERCSSELTFGFAFTDAVTDPYALEAAVGHCSETADQLAVDTRSLPQAHPLVEAYSALLALNVAVSFANLASLTGDLTVDDAERYATDARAHIDVIDPVLG